ncbi:hypothetical protein Y590_24785 [Methylobacterium sp. AMS5]|nr:hypothetical protein Y590_24785 [Methylobacterium sp. AMS5]
MTSAAHLDKPSRFNLDSSRLRALGALCDGGRVTAQRAQRRVGQAGLDVAAVAQVHQRHLRADAEIVQRTGIRVGQIVLVRKGPFAGFPAIVDAILPNDSVCVATSPFGGASNLSLAPTKV